MEQENEYDIDEEDDKVQPNLYFSNLPIVNLIPADFA